MVRTRRVNHDIGVGREARDELPVVEAALDNLGTREACEQAGPPVRRHVADEQRHGIAAAATAIVAAAKAPVAQTPEELGADKARDAQEEDLYAGGWGAGWGCRHGGEDWGGRLVCWSIWFQWRCMVRQREGTG
jgi:hypothetical protein